ncbi:MAG: hypothetical protein PHE25_05245, partial [Candidatus Gracilibacteria bacterium]|nr:hypothetical protein [Candidatus Gracilibacteria bacterium]
MEKDNIKTISNYYRKIILNTIFSIVIISLTIYLIIPLFNKYLDNKKDLIEKINNYEILEKKGLSFSGFLSKINDKETKTVVGKIGPDFFNQNLKNET